jgi:putative PIG3 family NAD(P)H quinone oxidoreductase
MKAIVVDQESAGQPLSWEEVEDPVCGAEEVLVDVYATAVNRADLLQRAGQYPPPAGAPEYLGLEMAGIVVEVGERVGKWQPGERVCALLAGGGYAEQVAVPQQQLMPVPEGWDFVRAGATPEVFLTAFVNLFMEGGLAKGETVLIHGGASGVGTAAIQLAREAGCRVLVTASHQDKLERCRQLGAEWGVNYKEQDFAAAVLEYCDGVDVVLDIAAADYLERNLEVLKLRGRLVCIALLTGNRAEIDLGLVLRKRLRVIGSVLRSRSLEEKAEIVHQFRRRFWPLLESGHIEPVIDTVLPISAAAQGHEILMKNANIGKVVLKIRD